MIIAQQFTAGWKLRPYHRDPEGRLKLPQP